MDILFQLTQMLSKEEVRHFKLYLHRTELENNRKDEALFDYIRAKREKYKEESIAQKLYPNQSKNSFYRLKNRLQEMIGKNMVLLHFGKEGNNEIWLNYQLYEISYKRENYYLADYFLKKAEKSALANEFLEALDLIYSSFITLSMKWVKINPEKYIELQKNNFKKLDALQKINQVIAAMHYRIAKSQNYGSEDSSLNKIVKSTIKEFANDQDLVNSKSFQIQFYKAISQQLLQSHQYHSLYELSENTYRLFEQKKWFEKQNHEEKIRMLIYTVNSLIRTREEKKALAFLPKLEQALKDYNATFHNQYYVFYINAQVNIYTELEPAKALTIITEFEKDMPKSKNAYYQQYLILNKALALYKLKKFDQSVRTIHRYYLNDFYKQSSPDFKAKVLVAELIIHFDSGDTESTYLRIEQVKKIWQKEKLTATHSDEYKIIEIISELIENVDNNIKNSALTRITEFLNGRKKENRIDVDIINYVGWLHELLERKRVRI